MIWVPITLLAATFQILRTSRQHELRKVLDLSAAGFVRYAYGLPLAALALFGVLVATERDMPHLPSEFWVFVVVGGLAQIVATVALLRSFQLRDFAIGTVYSKTEVIQVAIVSAVWLDEPIAGPAWIGVLACLGGVVWLAAPGHVGDLARNFGDPAAWMGVVAGGLFAVAAVGIRGASTALDDADPVWFRSLVTLTIMLALQTALNAMQLAWTDHGQLTAVVHHWRKALPVGVLSLLGSFAWATALTLASAASVRTLGQVELVMAFGISAWWLGEHHRKSEYVASAVVLVGVAIVVAVG